MGLSKGLLEVLACPDDKAAVIELTSGKNKGDLQCQKCKRIFEVKDGIPIMLPKNEKS